MTQFDDLLKRFKNETLSKEELEQFLSILDKQPEVLKTAIMDELTQPDSSVALSAAQKDQIIHSIFAERRSSAILFLAARKKRSWIAAAAILLLLIGSAGYFYFSNTPVRSPQAASLHKTAPTEQKSTLLFEGKQPIVLEDLKNGVIIKEAGLNISKEGKQIIFHGTGTGEAAIKTDWSNRYDLVLADGSRIWLNTGSLIRFPVSFSSQTREVYLEGEAYFDVQHDPRHPFIIHTGNLQTKVLGTAFNIHANPQNKSIEITVTRGKVGVSENDRSLAVLTQEQQIIYNEKTNNWKAQHVDKQQVVSWWSEDLHFEDIRLADAVVRLGKYYNIAIHLGNEAIAHCRFTGTIEKEKSLEQALKIICSFNKVTYENNRDGSIVISGKGCNQ
jgi:hypothetical protein